MKAYLVAIKTKQLDENKVFYHKLGFEFKHECHSNGVNYYSTNIGGLIFELYPCQEGEPPSNNRLGFELSSPLHEDDEILTHIEELASETHEFGGGQFYSVFTDPDGRSVELVYKK